ncbi:MAG TPA: lysophospholipid acyltransferase family protein [Polyangiales bacterium]
MSSEPSASRTYEPPVLPVPSERFRELLGTSLGHKALSLVIDYFHATLEGLEHLPKQGGALIVSNHALFAIDTAVLAALLVRDFGRHPRFLADRMLWKIPGFQQMIAAVGALPGHPEAAETLLKQGELVVVYPGGVDDSLKLDEQRYELQWKQRAGFAKVALRAQVPIIPVVGLGIDEMYSVLGREHFIGRRLFGDARYDLPLAFGAFGSLLPRRVPQHYIVLPPIPPTGATDSPEAVEQLRAQTYAAIDSRLVAARAALRRPRR